MMKQQQSGIGITNKKNEMSHANIVVFCSQFSFLSEQNSHLILLSFIHSFLVFINKNFLKIKTHFHSLTHRHTHIVIIIFFLVLNRNCIDENNNVYNQIQNTIVARKKTTKIQTMIRIEVFIFFFIFQHKDARQRRNDDDGDVVVVMKENNGKKNFG